MLPCFTVNTTGEPGPRRPTCDLCRAARITPWYHEDDICWVAECEICETPMVVWREHGVTPPPAERSHMHARLREVAGKHFGEIYIDEHMRNIPDHYHAHGRPVGGFFGRDFRHRGDLS
jgi:hypothetical protein